MPDDPFRQSTKEPVFVSMLDQISKRIAGGERQEAPAVESYYQAAEMIAGEDPFGEDPLEGMFTDVPHDPADPAAPTNEPTYLPGARPAQGRTGPGYDWFRGGEAPANFENRNHPVYALRRQFASTVNSQIMSQFDVTGAGVGYMRPPKASDANAGGRSGNSDHYSGGAIDFYGSEAELDRLAIWLREQPWTSFVRWRSESHHDHLHLSIALDWVAQQAGAASPVSTVRSAAPNPTVAPVRTVAPRRPVAHRPGGGVLES